MKNSLKSILIIFAGLFFLYSCENSISPANLQNQTDINNPQYIDFTGHYSSQGAVPQKLIAAVLPHTDRSALPVFSSPSNSDIRYYAKATSQEGETETVIEGSVNETNNSFIISGLKLGLTWKIEVGIEIKNNNKWVRCLYATDSKLFKVDDYTIEHTFFLEPDKSGNGSINLDLTVDSSIKKLSLTLDDINQRTTWNEAFAADANNICEITGNTGIIKLSAIPAGIYELTLNFYQTISTQYILAYSTAQTINVISGMTTESWRSDGSTLISGTGSDTFSLTEGLIKEYTASIIYVGQNAAADSINVYASDSNDGKPYSPLETVTEAIKRIKAAANPRDYKIYVSGTIKGSQEISAEITASDAKSITILGLNGLNSDNNPQDSLDGEHNADDVLTISTPVEVTINNLQITGGEKSGLKIQAGANVTIKSGVLIGKVSSSQADENNYGNKTCGIENKGSLKIIGSKINCNFGKGIQSGTNSNYSYLEMKGGKVSNNFETGIYIASPEDDSLLSASLTETEIFNNGADTNGADTNSEGGGFRADNGSSTEFIGCTIKENFAINGGGLYSSGKSIKLINCIVEKNKASEGGGGIWIQKTDELDLSGTTVIKDNFTSKGHGGAIRIASSQSNFYISGSVYIPYGVDGETGPGKNDVSLNGTKITVTGELTPPQENGKCVVAAIEPATQKTLWYRGGSYIQADGTNVKDLTPYASYFQLTDSDWYNEINPEDKTKLVINSPIYVAGPNIHPVCGKAGIDSDTINDVLYGTRENPYASIQKATSAIINDLDLTYTILVDGTLESTQTVSGLSYSKLAILIQGASPSDSSTRDQINVVDHNGSALTIDSSVSITIKNLKITGGASGFGGGIDLAKGAALTLDDDVVITGNTATEKGSGIFIRTGATGATLRVKGNVEVYENLNSNIYLLPDPDILIYITGPLVNSRDSKKKAKIGITTENLPTVAEPVTFTSGYKDHNAGIAPVTYFLSDTYAVTTDNNGEAVLQTNGGNLIIDDIYQDVKISLDNQWLDKNNTSKNVTLTATVPVNGVATLIEPGYAGEENKISYTFALAYHGEAVPEGYYEYQQETNNSAKLTFDSRLPAGNYLLTVKGLYNGKHYSAGFDITISGLNESITSEPVIDPDGDGTAGTGWTYVYFGDWPQTLKKSGVIVDEKKKRVQGNTGFVHASHNGVNRDFNCYMEYYLGSDGAWYVKCPEEAFASGYSYYDNTTPVAQAAAESYKYFKVEPIKWRILTTDYNGTGRALLFAEKILYAGMNPQFSPTYLNQAFLPIAFNTTAQGKIKNTYLSDIYNQSGEYKLFPLSKDELRDSTYFTQDQYRMRYSTDYAIATGLEITDERTGNYWTRTIGGGNGTCFCSGTGSCTGSTRTERNNPKNLGIVPALCIDWP